MQFNVRMPGIAHLVIIAALVGFLCSACQETQVSGIIEASGTIEAEEVKIASEFGGTVKQALADEGQEVEAGQILIRLDTDLLESQIGEAEAALTAARANLVRVEAGSRPSEIAVAEAALEQAVAAREGADRTWQDTLALRSNPQELNAKIDEAHTQVELAERQVEQARAQAATARIQRDAYAGAGDDESKTRYDVLDQQARAADAAVIIAEEKLAGARASVENLFDMRDNPIGLNTEVNRARARYEDTRAAVDLAQAKLNALLARPTEEEVAVARAQVSQAESALGMLQVQLEKMTLRSRLGGLVTNLAIHEGETASPGATLMTVAHLDEVKLTVYIPEDRYGRIQLGQSVSVEVDSYPGETYAGKVVYISSEAEFTPRNVQTKEERVNTVFAVKVLLPNPSHDLKPGMPADATIVVE